MPKLRRTNFDATILPDAERTSKRTTWAVLLLAALSSPGALPAAELLEQQLLREGPAKLATSARSQGDAQRGAILFHERGLGCATCHLPFDGKPNVGPDLTKPREDTTDAYLVESVLFPSKTIRKGFESIQVVLDDGRTITGLLVEDRPDELVLRNIAGNFETVRIVKETIDERQTSPLSAMPVGLVNQLANREQVLDLLKYVFEIVEYGPQRVAQLRPPPGLYATRELPEYERHVDHAGLLSELEEAGFRRGEAIYQRVCSNCHGTHDGPGSLPTSLRFASDRFKNGADPYSIYRTLTHGFGLMAPQTWMVPQEKYDVIHYLREAYLKPRNASQYVTVDADYLAALPKGDTRGPAPKGNQPWVEMDYGPSLTNTYEIGDDGSNFAYKGIAVRLDAGPGGVSQGRRWMVFDHDTLRVAGVWSRADDAHDPAFIDYNGIHFNGRHQVHPRIVGTLEFANRGLGWANPETGRFDDVRLAGRDNKPYGPLPRAWGHLKGLYHYDGRVVLSYTVGSTAVLEMPEMEGAGDDSSPVAFRRTFNIGPRANELVLQVADHPAGKARLKLIEAGQSIPGRIAVVEGDRSDGPGARLTFDGRTSLEPANPQDFDLSAGDYTIAARMRTTQGGTLFCQTVAGDHWVPGGKALFVRGGQLCFDVGWVGVVESRRKVDDGRWHDVAVTWQHKTGEVRLFIDGRPDGRGALRPGERLKESLIRIGFGAPDFPETRSYFRGDIADVRFYRRALADDELRQSAEGARDTSLVARWRLDGIDQPVASDVATGRHDARIVNRSNRTADQVFTARLSPDLPQARWEVVDDHLRLRIAAGDEGLKFTLVLQRRAGVSPAFAEVANMDADLGKSLHGGPSRWSARLRTQAVLGPDDGPFAVDVLTPPVENPWSCQMRLTGLDFYDDGQAAAVCTWDGDVWRVSGIDRPEDGLTWQRIASGLFQPLGLKIVEGRIYVGCRDQIVVLHDLNGDGETDFYENFNSDHQVTEHFHEFAMGLQTDPAGNFYYAKSARHALPAVVPHHGTLLRVARDGSRTDIVATGFRAANGVCLNSDGTFFVTDQEGHWTPKNRINWVEPGGFYGNLFGYHDVTDTSDDGMRQPLCWITNAFDRSPGELLWVTSDRWGELKNSLLELSYGAGKIFVVPHEKIAGQMQGGMCALPMPIFPTGVMRGRFHPTNGHLYACGMFAWAGNQTVPGGLYRARRTDKPVYVPIGLNALRDGVKITFSGPLARDLATDPGRYTVHTWSLRRTENYGSNHHDERELRVAAASLSADGCNLTLNLPDIQPTWCMSIEYRLKAADGTPVVGEIDNTIHHLGSDAE
jgi:putative heme-binding domain-containing protein